MWNPKSQGDDIIYWKKSTYKWTHEVKTCVVQGLSDWLSIRLLTYEEHDCVLQYRFLKQQAVKYTLKEKWEKYKQEDAVCFYVVD